MTEEHLKNAKKDSVRQLEHLQLASISTRTHSLTFSTIQKMELFKFYGHELMMHEDLGIAQEVINEGEREWVRVMEKRVRHAY